ncbi:tRNA pseudouridine synthase D [Pleurotus eryngii]|uniref:tRNA pseudouridine synthase D n=1 Tax=Pleurotus eryngii TaxID=5323 RepID=A0A9P5ZVU1_PLEER|nr:tRNA pseudouridine synthase D [Pleurotus eryngii]
MSLKHEAEAESLERASKRARLEDSLEPTSPSEESDPEVTTDTAPPKDGHADDILPPSHVLLGVPRPEKAEDGSGYKFRETDVGISEYVGRGVSQIEGIIKQRFTDFLVFEVDQDSKVIHLKSLAMPDSSSKTPKSTVAPEAANVADAMDATDAAVPAGGAESSGADVVASDTPVPEEAAPTVAESAEPWPESNNVALAPFLSEDAISKLKTMFLEGPTPPKVSDSGWGGRQTKTGDATSSALEAPPQLGEAEQEAQAKDKRGKARGGRGGRGRGGRGGGRGGRNSQADTRQVTSDPIESKSTRTEFHQKIRQLFQGKLETESGPAIDEGASIVIKWARGGRGRGGGGGSSSGSGRGGGRNTYPPYIHFSMQKTNRDTQDALGYLARTLHVNIRDLAVAGTKDKRGVTVQRVSLKRNNKTVEDVFKLANGISGRKSVEEALKKRGDRGVRITDFNYRKAGLELGMLKGNAFVITLRNAQVDSTETIDKALNTIKNKGFINYYGMQRFGTASVPTHAIGLAILKAEWQKAISLILRKRPGEHPDVAAARDAWLVDGDLDKALEMMPRRVVAERCILESYKKQKGDTRNAMGALSTIPRNLRLMYVHAYQSYVWNAIVSERIRTYGPDKPVVGDLIMEATQETPDPDNMEVDDEERNDTAEAGTSHSGKKSKKPFVPPKIKILAEEDLEKYSIFDIIMPLPGTDVAYPGGELGEKYRQYLRLDGLDPDNFVRKQKEYTLFGSYRKILHLPKELTWTTLRYTDPDVPLAQADEDKLLGFDPPVVTPDGKFLALQIKLTLGTAAYATMALREVTKTDTSSHTQISLTQVSEDQKYKGTQVVEEESNEDAGVE